MADTRQYQIRLASLERDWDALSWLRAGVEARVARMEEQPPTDLARGLDRMAGYVQADQLYVLTEGPRLIACHALTPAGDPAFWSRAERAQEALYLDNAMVRPDYMGQGLGKVITAHAIGEGCARQMEFLRLDCQRGNSRLRAHWETLGFEHVRDAVVPGRASGTLMEMRL
jgi:GNAT superfamily N-acetyltransferase